MSDVERLPSRIVQFHVVAIPAGPNNGEYSEVIVLLQDGSLWVQYHSNGFANVPTDNRWYSVHAAHQDEKPNRDVAASDDRYHYLAASIAEEIAHNIMNENKRSDGSWIVETP